MIELDKVKDINKSVNILTRSSDRWTNKAKIKGLKNKGMDYLEAVIPKKIYNLAVRYFGLSFWTDNENYYEYNYHKHEREIKAWIAEKEKAFNAEIVHSILGR